MFPENRRMPSRVNLDGNTSNAFGKVSPLLRRAIQINPIIKMLRQYFYNTEEVSGKSANDEKETDRRGEGVGCETASNRDEKQRRVRGPRRYDNTFTIEPNQFPFLTSSTPADD